MKCLFSLVGFLFFTNCFAQKHFGAYNTFESKAFATHYDKSNHVKKVYQYCVDNDSVKKIVSIDSIDMNGFVSKGWFYKFRTDSIAASFKINRTEKEVQSIEVEITPKSTSIKVFKKF